MPETDTLRREGHLPGDVITLSGGALLRYCERVQTGARSQDFGKLYRGPNELTVIVSIDDHGEPWGRLLHASISYPRGFPDWLMIYDISRAIFGDQVDTMMPIPREEAFIHGVTRGQKRGTRRQVFHVFSFPNRWPKWPAER